MRSWLGCANWLHSFRGTAITLVQKNSFQSLTAMLCGVIAKLTMIAASLLVVVGAGAATLIIKAYGEAMMKARTKTKTKSEEDKGKR